MKEPNAVEKLQEKIKKLESELAQNQQKLQNSGIELEANEGLLKFAMEDMRRIYDDMVKSQAQLMQSDKLATIGLMSAGIVHEINNPLSAVKLSFSLLKSKIDTLNKNLQKCSMPLDKENEQILKDVQEFLDQGDRCAGNIANIVTSIRTFSRSDKGVMTPVNINDVFDNVITVVWNAVKNKVKIKKEYGDLPAILCNSQQLGQVFLNLLVNASQAMDSSGSITIRTSCDGKNVCICVSDTGHGMTKEVMEKIFDAFFTTKGAEEGTGLGLSVTRDIIKKHDGDITVESEVGKGTAFTILLPVRT